MKQITILWMERKVARVIKATPSDVNLNVRIESNEPELPFHGVTPDYKRHRKESRTSYFSRILDSLTGSTDIVIFGSDNSKEEFLDFLSNQNEKLFRCVIGVEAAGDMPEEKIIARGRKYI
jgi:stalled ribosome rescue protein Dom34